MNSVQRLFDQQLGFKKFRTYDEALSRLRCHRNDEYRNILPLEDPDIETVDSPIFACKFAQTKGYEHLLALANEDGTVAIHNTDTGQRDGRQLHYNAIFDLAWMFERMKLVTVSGDHSAMLFDVAEGEIKNEREFTGHYGSVKTVAFRRNDCSVFATGGRDGSIIVWDVRSTGHGICNDHSHWGLNFPDRVISNSHFVSSGKSKKKLSIMGANSVTGLAFRDDNTLVSCGAGDGMIKFWDLRKNYKHYKREPTPKSVIPYCGRGTRNGFSNLLIDPTGVRLYVNCLDDNIYCYNVGTCDPEPIMRYTGHLNSTFYVKSCLSPDGEHLVSGSSDQNAYIWNLKHPVPFVKLKGHEQEVTCVAWRPKGDTLVVTCSDDMKHKIWRIREEEVPADWKYTGSGQAERVNRANEISYLLSDKSLDNRRKRLIETVDEIMSKKVSRECENCRKPLSINGVCKNCPSNPLKRKKSEETHTEPKRPHLTTPVKQENPPTQITPPNETEKPPILLENLPNYAMDGKAPHLHFSPLKRPVPDWLTRWREERETAMKTEGATPAKVPRVESPKSAKKKCPGPGGALLRFFKVTNGPGQQCVGAKKNEGTLVLKEQQV